MNQKNRIYKKHFVLFNNNGIISVSIPKDWARANQIKFKNYDFSHSKNMPTVNVIEKYLINNLGYHRIVNNEVVICYEYNNF